VSAVAGLAPWLPPGEPVGQLAGRQILLVHGSADEVTSPGQTWAYAQRAGQLAQVAAIEVQGGDHAMLRRARRWHEIAAEFSRLSFALSGTGGTGSRDSAAGEVAAAFARAAAGQPRLVI
jgi:fermentation-respiration switch protein FrsA (DUF1100 family)